MKMMKLMVVMGALCGTASMASAASISLSLLTSQGLFMDAGLTTLVPAGAYYQVYWSADSTYGGNSILESDADLGVDGTTPASFGDYVIFTGNTDIDGGLSSPVATGALGNSAVGGSTISSGFVYMYVYEDGSPDVGDSYVRSEVYGNTWGDPGAALPPPPDAIDVAATEPAVMGSFFVTPEPGTMALFGIGILTMAARRRRK